NPQPGPGTIAVFPLQSGERQRRQELRGRQRPGGRRDDRQAALGTDPSRTDRRPPGPGPGATPAALPHSQLAPQLSPPGVPQPVRLRHHAALYAGAAELVAEAHGERSMTHPLRSFLLHGSSIILLGLAGLALAAPKHAVTLYDEPPKYPADFTHFEYTN